MKGKEFIQRAKKYSKKHDLLFEVDKRRGKGGHAMLKLGDRKTVVKSGEIGQGLYLAMLGQLYINRKGF